ncbi:MAG: aspartate aminotransferase family protein [Proteobacteria bacterium]|nr:aspartate aminotransferase family protein [Pseudomonadota bacterium]
MTGLGELIADGSAGHAADKKDPEARATQADLLAGIRQAFPSPVSDQLHDASFVQTIARGLERLDGMKSQRPFLGRHAPLNYDRARRSIMPENMSTLDETVAELASYLEGLIIWGHPYTQENVIPPASIPSIVGQFFASIYNPNIIWDEYSHRLAEAELEVSSMCAALIGYDPDRSAGVFTWGGTGTIFYGVKLGLEKALPGSFTGGLREPAKVVSSEAGHYAKLSALGWLGLGTDNLTTVQTDGDNSMGLEELETVLTDLVRRGVKIACIIATMGTTDAFGIDNLEYIVRLRDRLCLDHRLDYRPHVHADAVIGWPWSVFNDYDFDRNPMGFPARTLRSLWDARAQIRRLGLADSIGLDFHKTGYAPYTSSLFICRRREDLDLITRDQALMPYLFQFGNYHPGVFTMEASRSGGAVMSALANLKFFGKQGYRAILGHIVSMAEELRARLTQNDHVQVVNDYNYGPVTLFRAYPDGVDPMAAYRREVEDPAAGAELLRHNEYNQRVFDVLHHQAESGEGLALSLTDRYRVSAGGEPILALKSYVMSPFIDPEAMDKLMACLDAARRQAG